MARIHDAVLFHTPWENVLDRSLDLRLSFCAQRLKTSKVHSLHQLFCAVAQGRGALDTENNDLRFPMKFEEELVSRRVGFRGLWRFRFS